MCSAQAYQQTRIGSRREKSAWLATEQAQPRWQIQRGDGPVIATAVHAGHYIRPELRSYLAASPEQRRREEDPLTDIWASVADHVFINRVSRFEVDLNRSRDRAVATDPADTWGLKIWAEAPPAELLARSLQQHDEFYALMAEWLEALIAAHGRVLLLDIHSYNHRRDGPARPAPAAANPDIDLGITTANLQRFGSLIDTFTSALAQGSADSVAGEGSELLDVRANVRYPDGGHWPEWVFSQYGDAVCTVTLEYKKFYMDEWQGSASLARVEQLRVGLAQAVAAVRAQLVGG